MVFPLRLLPILALMAGPGPATDAADAEQARQAGTWSVVSMIRDEEETPRDILDSIRRVVEGDHVVWTRAGKNFAGTRFEVNPAKTPAEIDLIPDGGKDRDVRVLGIYRFEADGTLRICVADAGQPRPTSFDAGRGSRHTLQAFRKLPDSKVKRAGTSP